mmetsp:Transcript_11157/g.17240  ORF Transcript_11157/g.17240 Transcript_11157/m.17240 type:complete len:227 (-) Transcript_11157:543-1223(-)
MSDPRPWTEHHYLQVEYDGACCYPQCQVFEKWNFAFQQQYCLPRCLIHPDQSRFWTQPVILLLLEQGVFCVVEDYVLAFLVFLLLPSYSSSSSLLLIISSRNSFEGLTTCSSVSFNGTELSSLLLSASLSFSICNNFSLSFSKASTPSSSASLSSSSNTSNNFDLSCNNDSTPRFGVVRNSCVSGRRFSTSSSSLYPSSSASSPSSKICARDDLLLGDLLLGEPPL